MAILNPITEHLQASDLDPKQDTVVTIQVIERKTIKGKDGKPDEVKWVAKFKGMDQDLILNATNIASIKAVLNVEDTDDMKGKQISLYVKPDVQFGSKTMPGIRVRVKP
jgi:hypothetical protein